jgi:hypothetical protein
MVVDQVKVTEKTKSVIFYSRAGKKLEKHFFLALLEFLLLAVPVEILLVYFITALSDGMVNFAGYFFNNYDIYSQKFLSKRIYFLSMEGKFPSFNFSLMILLGSALLIILLTKIKKIPIPKPVSMWIVFLCLINLTSSLFFLLSPQNFPYAIREFSDLYIKIQIGMWLCIPIILGLSLSFFPVAFISKTFLLYLTLIYSIIFGVVRYAFFLVILVKYSYLFMLVIFFVFGPLLDFVYLVGFYSFYVSFLSRKYSKDIQIWHWLF